MAPRPTCKALSHRRPRQAVADVVAQVNAGIKAVAQADHLVVADFGALTTATFGTDISPNTTVQIGNVTIHLDQSTSSNPSTAGFVSDGIHPNTTLQGVIADLFVQASTPATAPAYRCSAKHRY